MENKRRSWKEFQKNVLFLLEWPHAREERSRGRNFSFHYNSNRLVTALVQQLSVAFSCSPRTVAFLALVQKCIKLKFEKLFTYCGVTFLVFCDQNLFFIIRNKTVFQNKSGGLETAKRKWPKQREIRILAFFGLILSYLHKNVVCCYWSA